MRIIYVDDNKINLLQFQRESGKIANITSLELFDDAGIALQYCRENRVDLAFLDIIMRDNDGFWLAAKLRELHIQIAFLTAYNNYAQEAFLTEAIHYLIKPVQQLGIQEAMQRTLRSKRIDAAKAEMSHGYDEYRKCQKRIFIKNRFNTEIVDLTNILYFSGSGSYTHIKTSDGNTFVSSKLLSYYTEILRDHPDFIRIHRSYLVNKYHVRAIGRNKRKHTLRLSDNTDLDISPSLKETIFNLLA